MINLQKDTDVGIQLILTFLQVRNFQCKQALTQFICKQNMKITLMRMSEVDWYLLNQPYNA